MDVRDARGTTSDAESISSFQPFQSRTPTCATRKRSSRDLLLAAERARIPFRRVEQRDVRAGVDHLHLLGGSLPLDTITSLICRQTVTTRSTRFVRYLPRFQTSSGNETPRLTTNAPTGRAPSPRGRGMRDSFVHVNDVRPFVAHEPPQRAMLRRSN